MSRTERKAFKKDNYISICIFSYLCSLIFRIPLLYMIGEKAVYLQVENASSSIRQTKKHIKTDHK